MPQVAQNSMQTQEKIWFHEGLQPRIVPKVWGHEEWIVNNNSYCGKKLVFKSGYQCSLHYHKIKSESFYVATGVVLLELRPEHFVKSFVRVMKPGDVCHIEQHVRHRISAITDAEIFEFSTFHRENDSYREIEAGKIDLMQLKLTHSIDNDRCS